MSERQTKSGLAKAATIFAVGLGISLGLCGVNFAIAMSGIGGQTFMSGSPARGVVQILFAWMARLEIAGIAICLAGLIIVGLAALVKLILPNPSSGDPQ